jgi:hypothetical protein
MAQSHSQLKYPSRRFRKDHGRGAIKVHAQLTGEVIWAWNGLQLAFCHLFYKLFPEESSYYAMIIWNGIAVDSTQRAILNALLDEQIHIEMRPAKAAMWAIRKMGELAKYRNDVVHGHFGFRIAGKHRVETRIAYFGNPLVRVRRQHGHGLESYAMLRTLRGDLLQLADYVSALGQLVGNVPKRGPLPRRPKLRMLAARARQSWQPD